MTGYTVRIELHAATYDDYETLHTAMQSAGFSRTIKSDNGTIYQLPTAEYSVSSDGDVNAVLKAASNAAARTGKNYGALVTAAGPRAWIGLTQLR